jgi:hypothetical protein
MQYLMAGRSRACSHCRVAMESVQLDLFPDRVVRFNHCTANPGCDGAFRGNSHSCRGTAAAPAIVTLAWLEALVASVTSYFDSLDINQYPAASTAYWQQPGQVVAAVGALLQQAQCSPGCGDLESALARFFWDGRPRDLSLTHADVQRFERRTAVFKVFSTMGERSVLLTMCCPLDCLPCLAVGLMCTFQ